MNIGEVSRMVNMPVSTIRYYDNEGLFTSLKKDSAGNRVFLKEDLEQLKIIECLKKSGMQIKEIKQFMTWVAEGSQTIPQRKKMFLHRKEFVKNKMKELEKTLSILEYKCWYYEEAQKLQDEKKVHNIPVSEMPLSVQEGYHAIHG